VPRANRDVWTEGEVQVAISDLSDADVMRLRQAARVLEKVCRLKADDLLNEAIVRVLDMIRTIPRSKGFMAVMYGVMRSIASSDGKRHDNSKVDGVDDEKLNSFEGAEELQDDALYNEDLRRNVLALFEGDTVGQMICEGWFFDGMTDKELCDLTELNETKLASAKMAVFRRLRKSEVGALLRNE
jgi:DNA-directed RNA polymerase specialized sigma24 family protein